MSWKQLKKNCVSHRNRQIGLQQNIWMLTAELQSANKNPDKQDQVLHRRFGICWNEIVSVSICSQQVCLQAWVQREYVMASPLTAGNLFCFMIRPHYTNIPAVYYCMQTLWPLGVQEVLNHQMHVGQGSNSVWYKLAIWCIFQDITLSKRKDGDETERSQWPRAIHFSSPYIKPAMWQPWHYKLLSENGPHDIPRVAFLTRCLIGMQWRTGCFCVVSEKYWVWNKSSTEMFDWWWIWSRKQSG